MSLRKKTNMAQVFRLKILLLNKELLMNHVRIRRGREVGKSRGEVRGGEARKAEEPLESRVGSL